MADLEEILSDNLVKLRAENLDRQTIATRRLKKAYISRNGRKLLSFSCNDYLGLQGNRSVIKAAKSALGKFGSGSCASRMITGSNDLYDELEAKIAEICYTEAAVVFGSGYLANIGVITSLMGSRDLIIADKLSHSCIIDGSLLPKAELKRFAHNDLESLKTIISKYRKNYKNCLVITEAVFSMDGDTPDLKKIKEICEQHDAWMMVDYAHDLNHLAYRAKVKPDIIMGTLSKAVASYGGYIAGSKNLIDFIKSTSRTLIFTTALPPSVVASSLKALDIIQKQKWRAKKALDNAAYFRNIISDNLPNLNVGKSSSQIVPVIIGSVEETMKLSEYLLQKGFLVHAIRPPTVPANTSRLRFSFSSEHERSQIDRLCKELIKYFRKN